jgi:capsular polysaccharide biosynthesis protein
LHNSQSNSKDLTASVSVERARGASAEAAKGEYIEYSEYIPSLREIFGVIQRRLYIVLIATVTIAGAGIAWSLVQTPMYEASIKVLIGQEQGNSTPGTLGADVQGLQQITRTMAEAITTYPVAEAVISQQNLRVSPNDLLEEYMSAQQIPNTQFIEVSYTDPSPEKAQGVANAIGEIFSERVSEVSPSSNAVTATVWEPAQMPENPVSPNLMLNTAVAILLGLASGVGLAFLLEYLDDSWRSPEEAEQVSGVPTFAVIPEFEALTGEKEAGGY